MRSPPLAIAWLLCVRYRWWLMAGAVYFVAIALACQVMPTTTTFNTLRVCLFLPLMATPLGLMAVFIFGADAEFESRQSNYPARMFVLPLRTSALVGWPMLFGAATMFLTCMAIGQLILRTVWLEMPLLWPVLLAVACLAWLQALAWSPFPLPWLRIVTTVAVIGGVIAAVTLAYRSGVANAFVIPALLTQPPLAFVMAVIGVRRARHSHSPDWIGLAKGWHWIMEHVCRLLPVVSTSRRAFRSPMQAQLWLEWRLHGLGLPVGVALVLPIGCALIVLAGDNSRLGDECFLCQPLSLLLLPMLLSVVSGPDYGAFASHQRQNGTCSFQAIRPFDCTSFVVIKFRMVLISVLVCYALIVPVVVVLEFVTGRYREIGLLVGYLAGARSPVAILASGLGGLALLVAGTWRFVTDSLFMGLTGRRWVATSAVICCSVVFYGLAVLAWWIYKHPEHHGAFLASMPWLLGSLIALKLLLGTWVLWALRRRRLLSMAAIAKFTGLWLAVVATMMTLIAWLGQRSGLPWYLMVCGAILAVPLVRISLAPLALAWNRHR